MFLVIRAPSITLNSTLDQRIVDQALERMQPSAKGEWLAEFRDDAARLATSDHTQCPIYLRQQPN
jgi:hypothetical protein